MTCSEFRCKALVVMIVTPRRTPESDSRYANYKPKTNSVCKHVCFSSSRSITVAYRSGYCSCRVGSLSGWTRTLKPKPIKAIGSDRALEMLGRIRIWSCACGRGGFQGWAWSLNRVLLLLNPNRIGGFSWSSWWRSYGWESSAVAQSWKEAADWDERRSAAAWVVIGEIG